MLKGFLFWLTSLVDRVVVESSKVDWLELSTMTLFPFESDKWKTMLWKYWEMCLTGDRITCFLFLLPAPPSLPELTKQPPWIQLWRRLRCTTSCFARVAPSLHLHHYLLYTRWVLHHLSTFFGQTSMFCTISSNLTLINLIAKPQIKTLAWLQWPCVQGGATWWKAKTTFKSKSEIFLQKGTRYHVICSLENFAEPL